MDTQHLQKRCQPLSVDADPTGPALSAVDDALREWIAALDTLSACGLDVERLRRSARGSPTPLTEKGRVPLVAPPDEPPGTASGKPSTAGTAEAPAPEAATDTTADEEALLASLDPETVQAIRVKRRLGSKRPIPELIAEIQASRDTQRDPEPRRRTWWRRTRNG